ncbi:MAG: tetratricopeptide repeat protein, partial [Bryobacteraceae bacterium]
ADYLRYFGNTDTAPNAQYYIGEIAFNRKDYDGALKAFDLVLERYPENNKTLDATYMKGLALVRMGQRTKGAAEFREVIRRQPHSELATKARAQLSSLGLPLAAPVGKKNR